MADRTIKPDDTNDLVLQNNDGSAKIEINEAQNIVLTGGSTTALTIDSSGNITLAGTANNIGTITAGTIGSSVAFPSTMIRQVKVTTTDSVFSTTSSSFSDVTGMSVDITPTSSSSKILLFCEFRMGNNTSASNTAQFLRNSTALDLGGTTGNLGNIVLETFHDTSFTLLDQPSTTSAITYKLQVATTVGTLYINGRNDGANPRNGTFYAMEVL